MQESSQVVMSDDTDRQIPECSLSLWGDMLRRQEQEPFGLQAAVTGHSIKWVTFLGSGDGQ